MEGMEEILESTRMELAKDKPSISSIPCVDPSILADPQCLGLREIPNSSEERARVSQTLQKRGFISVEHSPSHRCPATCSSIFPVEEDGSPLFIHLAHGLAYTVGSALGSTPPSTETCLASYIIPNKAGLTAGSRAWSKHAHRSLPLPSDKAEEGDQKRSAGWWGIPSGPVSLINERSLQLFWKVMNSATWRNLHWLPHEVLVYEVRVVEGYGMRWSQDQAISPNEEENEGKKENRVWIFRGFVEPAMENGHELNWRHPISPS